MGISVNSNSPPSQSLSSAHRSNRSHHHQHHHHRHHHHHQQQQQHPDQVDYVSAENRQLRQERDILMDKLIRSKSTLKETLDRLNTKDQHKSSEHTSPPFQQATAQAPSPKPRRLLSSSHVLQSAGLAPSRSKVTQDFIEFSRTHEHNLSGRSQRSTHSGVHHQGEGGHQQQQKRGGNKRYAHV